MSHHESETKVLSYNALTGFSDTDRQDALVDFVRTENPDVAFFAEARGPDEKSIAFRKSVAMLTDLGYEVTTGVTDPPHLRSDSTGFVGLVRNDLGEGETVQIGHREGFYATAGDITVTGIHLDDRNEDIRLSQVPHIPETDVLMGDLNAMHKHAPIARALRILRPITEALPEVDPNFGITTQRSKQVVSLAQRVVRMADGRTLQAIHNQHGLRESDPTLEPTIHGIAQIDHILISETLEARSFKVHKDIKLSDHKPISAVLYK